MPPAADKVQIIMSGPRILSAAVQTRSQLLFLIVESVEAGDPVRGREDNQQEEVAKIEREKTVIS